MAHVENHDLGVIGIDSVKDEIRVANGWKHADAGFVGEMTSLGKILEEVGNGLDAFNHRCCGCAIVFVNVGEYVVDVRSFRTSGPSCAITIEDSGDRVVACQPPFTHILQAAAAFRSSSLSR